MWVNGVTGTSRIPATYVCALQSVVRAVTVRTHLVRSRGRDSKAAATVRRDTSFNPGDFLASCPYTWVRGLFSSGSKAAPGEPARNLMVLVVRNGEERVRVALPSRSARWLIELIPADVVTRIREEEIPLEAITEDLNRQEVLYPRPIFSLDEPDRQVTVWLE